MAVGNSADSAAFRFILIGTFRREGRWDLLRPRVGVEHELLVEGGLEVLEDVLEAGDFVIDHSKSDHHNTLQLIFILISSEKENWHNMKTFCPYQSIDNKLINVFQEKSRSIICCISKQNSHASLAFHTCFSFSFCVSQKLLTRSKKIPKILLIQQLLTSKFVLQHKHT